MNERQPREEMLGLIHEAMSDRREVYVRLVPPDDRGYCGGVVGRPTKLGLRLSLALHDGSSFAMPVDAIALVQLLPKGADR